MAADNAVSFAVSDNATPGTTASSDATAEMRLAVATGIACDSSVSTAASDTLDAAIAFSTSRISDVLAVG